MIGAVRLAMIAATVGLGGLMLSACGDGRQAEPGQDLIADGLVIAKANCAQCHAVEKAGASPRQEAPVFRTILSRYGENALADDLREGIRIGHPDMPRIQLRPEGVDALMAYLRSIQETPTP